MLLLYEMEFILRNINHNTILTGLLLLSVIMLVLSKYLYFHQFTDWINITHYNKYITLYSKTTKKISLYNTLIYLFFVINATVYVYVIGNRLHHNISSILFVFIAINVYVLCMYLIKKICFEVLDISFIMDKILFQKITLNHYIGIILFIFNLFFLYLNESLNTLFIYASIFFLVVIYVFALFLVVFQNLKWVLKHWFYFILYLCTFKISPLLVGGFLFSRY